MNNLILVNIIFSAFFLLYVLLLKRLTFFRINRFYLLGSLLFSLLVPFIKFDITPQQVETLNIIMLPEVVLDKNIAGSAFSFLETILAIYLSGIMIGFLLFLNAFIKVWRLRSISRQQTNNINRYFLSEGTHAFSFFHLIYIGKELETGTRDMILQHELVHLKHRHSLDVMLYALAGILFWFNPFIHLAALEVRLNHEFLADEAVSRHYGKDYQYCLLNQALNTQIFSLTNSFFSQSLIKNRIIMMNKKRSTGRLSAIYALVIPLIAGSLWLSSCTERTEQPGQETPQQEKTSFETEELDKMPQFPGGNEAMMEYFRTGLTYPTGLKDAGVSGRCVIEFTVNEDGSITDVKSVKSDHPKLEDPAIKFVKSMPDWTPGEKDGKKVKTKMYLPVQFSLS